MIITSGIICRFNRLGKILTRYLGWVWADPGTFFSPSLGHDRFPRLPEKSLNDHVNNSVTVIIISGLFIAPFNSQSMLSCIITNPHNNFVQEEGRAQLAPFYRS